MGFARKHTLFLNVVKETYNKDPSLCMYPKKYPLTSSVAYYLNPGGTCEKSGVGRVVKEAKGPRGERELQSAMMMNLYHRLFLHTFLLPR
jgi:hypothetical protein